MNYYNFNKSDVGVLLLDASKNFDTVNYCLIYIFPSIFNISNNK